MFWHPSVVHDTFRMKRKSVFEHELREINSLKIQKLCRNFWREIYNITGICKVLIDLHGTILPFYQSAVMPPPLGNYRKVRTAKMKKILTKFVGETSMNLLLNPSFYSFAWGRGKRRGIHVSPTLNLIFLEWIRTLWIFSRKFSILKFWV